MAVDVEKELFELSSEEHKIKLMERVKKDIYKNGEKTIRNPDGGATCAIITLTFLMQTALNAQHHDPDRKIFGNMRIGRMYAARQLLILKRKGYFISRLDLV